MRIQRRSMKKARIEIIPMIDTIFFLLVFFMISTLSYVAIQRHAGQSAQSGLRPAGSRRKRRDHH
jgi:biopolymer transport protein ExbD